jgi:unspecific monooxygenase
MSRDGDVVPFLEDLRACLAARDPGPAIDRLRERDPVHWVDALGVWFVTRHEDVRRLFADPRLTPDPRAWERHCVGVDADPGAGHLGNPFHDDSPGQAGRARRIVSAALTPRAVARMEARMQEVVEHFAAPLRGRRDVVDLIEAFASPIPGTVIGRITGVPAKDADEERFRELARKTVRSVNPILSDEKRRRTEQAHRELFTYVRGLTFERLMEPREDLISDLLQVSAAGSTDVVEDVVGIVAALVATGTEATVLAATRALYALLRHPDQLALLRADRALLPDAIEELLRFDAGLTEMPRYALVDFELHGAKIRKGQLLILSMAGAHRDPRVYADPTRLDLRRRPRDLVVFGFGPHYCIGASLARAELRVMLEAALDFLPPGARLLEDQVRWSTKGLANRMKSLPVAFG